MSVQIDGINVHTDNSHSSLVRNLGCQWVRIDVNWWEIERSKGSFSWSKVDSIVNHYKSAGMMIYATLMGSPAWHRSSFNRPPDVYVWKNFCTNFAKRYVGKVHVMSLWNEPNLGTRFWTGSRKEFFEVIIKGGHEAIKAVNPNILIAGPDLATISSSDWPDWFSDMAKYKNYIDIFAMHTYHSTSSETERCWNWGKVPIVGWFIPKWQPYKWYIKNINRPTYLTETGLEATYGNSKQMKKQKDYVSGMMKIKKDLKIDFIFFYCLFDADPNAEEPFGFYSIDGKPKTVAV